MNVSFTGTRAGMTSEQHSEVAAWLEKFYFSPDDEFHYGAAIGADDEAAILADQIGFQVVAHPAEEGGAVPIGHVLPERPALKRNPDIVDAGAVLLATPRLGCEERRSGTWATIRYARRIGKDVTIIWPSGIVEGEERI